MRALLMPVAAGAARCTTAARPWCSPQGSALPALLGPASRRGSTVAVDAARSHLHETAGEGPQPETLFRPDAAALCSSSGGGGGEEADRPLKEGELPGFGGLPAGPDYGAERPQEQTAPEPENPLPADLPPNHPQREGEAPPEGPGPLEVPLPRGDEPDIPIRAPPEIIPSPAPAEAPPRNIPTEVPAPSAPPEFSPGAPAELPQRGGSEISFPGSEVRFP